VRFIDSECLCRTRSPHCFAAGNSIFDLAGDAWYVVLLVAVLSALYFAFIAYVASFSPWVRDQYEGLRRCVRLYSLPSQCCLLLTKLCSLVLRKDAPRGAWSVQEEREEEREPLLSEVPAPSIPGRV
jgi:hypothetical protein